jgi:hypothetical protein
MRIFPTRSPAARRLTTGSRVPEIDFKRATIEQQVKDGTLAGGLAFIYIYSNADSFEVKLDATGNVVYVQEQEGIRGMPGN